MFYKSEINVLLNKDQWVKEMGNEANVHPLENHFKHFCTSNDIHINGKSYSCIVRGLQKEYTTDHIDPDSDVLYKIENIKTVDYDYTTKEMKYGTGHRILYIKDALKK